MRRAIVAGVRVRNRSVLLQQRGLKPPETAISRYLVVIEQTTTGFSAYFPDVPGCVSTGKTREEVEAAMREVIEFHLDGLRQDGAPIPKPSASAAYVDVAA